MKSDKSFFFFMHFPRIFLQFLFNLYGNRPGIALLECSDLGWVLLETEDGH